ncbi:hypothetical protein Tco_0705291 [Tanacetum coccineum]|uniref:Uncharacterized protein n=1 Tax=Tanacetum coccineum TaxID=301880 RepID=A0ABQ4Y462_9ASTR
MESIKKSIDERALHKREYDTRVNERQMQITEGNVDTSIALDASLVDTESSGTESKEQDISSRLGNDAHADDANIKPIYDEEPMAEVQLTTECNVFATGQQQTEQPEFNNEGEVDQNAEQCHDKLKINEAKVKHDIDVIETINIELEYKVAKLLKENETLKKHYKELSDSIKITRAKTIEHTTSLIAQNAEFKAERESAFAKPHHVIASSESRNSAKNMPRFSSNDMVHNQYLEKARKKTQESGKNSRPSVVPSARLQSTFLNDVNSRAKVSSHKTTTRYKPVEQISVAKKPERQIPTGHRYIHKCSGGTKLDLSAGTPSNLTKERIKACIKENVISGSPRLHGIALIQEISRQKSQGIRSLLTS